VPPDPTTPTASRNSRSTYREFNPGPILRRDLVCLWILSVHREGEIYVQPVLPDGCMDILWVDERPPFVVGPMTRPVLYPLPPGSQVVGARFFPGVAPSWLQLPASLLTDLEIPLRESWGALANTLTAQLAETPGLECKLQILRTALESRCGFIEKDHALAASVDWLARNPAGDIGQLAAILGITSRQLLRRFRATVGYGPKMLQRIMRFQRLLQLAATLTGRSASLAALALEAGYADQAHMTREFRQLAPGTPASLLFQSTSALALSGWFES
jgi:AraC-like DNA-binding protein